MKKKLLIFGFIVFALAIFVLNLLNGLGQFRSIESRFSGKFVANIDLIGAEDMTASEDGGFLIISSFDRASRNAGNLIQGGLYFMDLKTDTFQVKSLAENIGKPFYPHGIDMIRLDSSRHRLFVINHVGDSNMVEVFTLYDRDSLVHEKTLTDEKMFSPNDIVAIGENEFYFTNDKNSKKTWGKFQETYLQKKRCRITYFDGENYRDVIENGMPYSNGIRYDFDRKLMYIASSRNFSVSVYNRLENGDLEFVESIPCGTGVDNIELDEEGNLWIGCHPKLLAFSNYAKGKQEVSPSEIIKITYKSLGDYEISSVFLDDGSNLSGMSTAAIYKDLIFTGNVMDDHFLILKQND
jgi:arylesterase/paraoxonase